MIARALHDVDVPPFDSIEAVFGQPRALRARRSGGRHPRDGRAGESSSALVRTHAASEDRRRRMPTASDFRRELRAADALLYAQRQAALRALPPAPPPSPPLPAPVTERHRTATIAAGILAGLTLIAAGEVMHLRSIPAAEVTRASETQAAPEPIALPAANRKPAVRDAQNLAGSDQDRAHRHRRLERQVEIRRQTHRSPNVVNSPPARCHGNARQDGSPPSRLAPQRGLRLDAAVTLGSLQPCWA